MTKDRILLGGLAGMVGNIPKELMAWIMYWFGWIRYTFDHFCAGIFVPPAAVYDPVAIVLGLINDFVFSGIYGVLFYLIFKKTGVGRWFLKSLVMGFGLFTICFGILRPLLAPKLVVVEPLVNLLYLAPNVMYSVVTCWFIQKFGDVAKDSFNRK